MDYRNILEFKYTWRKYQARVLEHTKEYIADGKVHIVAAPGSGKTTLGIELIGRMREVALVLAPSITIREQWKERIVEGFLCEGLHPDDYISQDLKKPKAITIATYQALHSAMNHYKGSLGDLEKTQQETDTDDRISDSIKCVEEVDYSDFDIIKTLQENRVGLLCLDECHHLRSEWWKALEELKRAMGALKVIALTATPPYDSNATMWKRYMDMCGEIDEEITIPELVKEGSLCPHQDYVYFNYPTAEEEAEVAGFRMRSYATYEKLMEDAEFAATIQSHRGLCGMISDDELLDDPEYLAAILIFLQEKNMEFPERLKRLLGKKRLPSMDYTWMERLLQGFLYTDTTGYSCDEEYRKELIDSLKSEGLIEKRKVCFATTPSIEKLLTTSKGKCESIKDIVEHEYKAMGKELRLLVLTDYIRKEYEKAVGTQDGINALGVIPFFEQLRRSLGVGTGLRLGVLCGTIIVIPAEAKEALLETIGEKGKVTFSSIGVLGEEDYVKVMSVGDAHFLTGAVTDVFRQGYMQVLIGTKSLLGEGWDSPCINSLILASFVGSFMLSNQMRGRAIRVFKENPEKTSNIWHLVCLPSSKKETLFDGEISEDYSLLERRMEHFLGLHYTEDTIENGIERLSIIEPPFDEAHVTQMNQQMLALSGERAMLRERWERSLAVHRRMDIIEETEVIPKRVPTAVFYGNACSFVGALAVLFAFVALKYIGFSEELWLFGALAALLVMLTRIPKILQLMNGPKRLRAVANGIRKALLSLGIIEGTKTKVVVNKHPRTQETTVYLTGGTGRDKALFVQCVKEFFGVIDNQRYILVRKRMIRGENDFYAVPECFGKRKEDAQKFYECVKPYIGKFELVYTRNEAGRPILLEGRMKALVNKKAARSRKCVK